MAETREQVKGNILYYKNKPLVREKDTICYGDFTERCVLIFEIMSYVEKEGVKVPGKIFIQIIESESGKILKQADKEGMFEAFNYGIFWYEKFLSES
ncbi:MAG: hypothetical protein IJD74_00115 [Clostridia bacterium]|nr:hypothetical protein [Clostridia bacterium]MBR4031878.1 hypothetical protein [Clostridia bacterium]